VAIIIAVALFFAVWWMLVSGDEAPWVPAGLAASVVLLVAFSAREVVMRRAWTRYLLEDDKREPGKESSRKSTSSKSMHSSGLHSAALRTIQNNQPKPTPPVCRQSLILRFSSLPGIRREHRRSVALE